MTRPNTLECACFKSKDGKSFIIIQHTDERGDATDGSANFRAEASVEGKELPDLKWVSESEAFEQAKRLASVFHMESTGKWY